MNKIPLLTCRPEDKPFIVVETIAIPAPVAGAEFTFTVPAGKRIYVCALRAQLVTDATAPSRFPAIIISSVGGIIASVASGANALTSSTWSFTWTPGVAIYNGSAAQPNSVVPWPPDVILEEGTVITSLTGAIAAADQWSLITLQTLTQFVTED
jgi:hypothetical protein